MHPHKSFMANIRSQINSWFADVFMLRPAHPAHSETRVLGESLWLPIACFLFHSFNLMEMFLRRVSR